jgi:hypothetical protein
MSDEYNLWQEFCDLRPVMIDRSEVNMGSHLETMRHFYPLQYRLVANFECHFLLEESGFWAELSID